MAAGLRSKARDWRYVAALALIAAGTIAALTYNISRGDDRLLTPAYAADATARQATVGGRQVGEVLVGGQVVLRIRTAAGGLSPYRRAQTVAERLEMLMGDSLQPEDITTGIMNGMEAVVAGGQVLVTADAAHARINGTSPTELAETWAGNLRTAFGGTALAATASQPTSQKIVPIISACSGVRIGGAQVTGPRDRVDDVVAVGQIEGTFGSSVRARVLVPVSSENVVQRISRVPQTSVTALVDIRL